MIKEPLSLVSQDNGPQRDKRKARLQSKIYIPHGIHPSFIRGIYVANKAAKERILELFADECPVLIDLHPTLFFVGKANSSSEGSTIPPC